MMTIDALAITIAAPRGVVARSTAVFEASLEPCLVRHLGWCLAGCHCRLRVVSRVRGSHYRALAGSGASGHACCRRSWSDHFAVKRTTSAPVSAETDAVRSARHHPVKVIAVSRPAVERTRWRSRDGSASTSSYDPGEVVRSARAYGCPRLARIPNEHRPTHPRRRTPASQEAGMRRGRMAATRKQERSLSDADVAKVLALIKDSDSVELKLTVPETEHSADRRGARHRPARCPDPAGVLLRHAGPGAYDQRRGRPRPSRAEEGRRLGRQAAAGRAVRASGPACAGRPSSASRSTRCPAASSARAR